MRKAGVCRTVWEEGELGARGSQFVMRRNSAHQREMYADHGADETYLGV